MSPGIRVADFAPAPVRALASPAVINLLQTHTQLQEWRLQPEPPATSKSRPKPLLLRWALVLC
jgi:hypothetical protein